jgi:hypothetical protein
VTIEPLQGWAKFFSLSFDFILLVSALVGVAVAAQKTQRLFIVHVKRSDRSISILDLKAAIAKRMYLILPTAGLCVVLFIMYRIDKWQSLDAKMATFIGVLSVCLMLLFGPIYEYFRDIEQREDKKFGWIGRLLKFHWGVNLIFAFASLLAFFWKAAEFGFKIRS